MAKHPLKLYLFFCSNSLDAKVARRYCKEHNGDTLKTISLPCSGKVELIYLLKAFESGADGVAIVTCRRDACRYLEGNLRAKRRVEAVDTLLEEIGLGKGRIQVIRPKEDDNVEDIMREVDAFRTTIGTMTEQPT